MPTRSRTTSPRRGHRLQANEVTSDDDARPLVVRPLVQTDPVHNPDGITVDEAAIAAGIEHGGTVERRVEALQVRGSGGRKRSGTRGGPRSGRDSPKTR